MKTTQETTVKTGTKFTQEAIAFVPDSPEKTTLKTRVKTRVKILELIKNNSNITREKLADILEITIKGVDWHISNLKKEGKLERIGPDKGGRWKVMRLKRSGGRDRDF